MTLTLLIDLDDTLLANEMNTFVSAYLKALAGHMRVYAMPDQLITTLLAATQKMMVNKRPDRTLKETFDAAFYPVLGLNSAHVRGVIDEFYANVFPTLRSLTHTQPGAVELVEWAMGRGDRLVVATNPLFPRTAILQRLEWADLSAQKYHFNLITSYEVFHFAKPNPAYFAEILACLGWPEGPVVVVGDDLDLDCASARSLGLSAYWITSEKEVPPNCRQLPTAKGTLAEVKPWLEAISPEKLHPTFSAPDALIAILCSTPAALTTLTANLPGNGWSQSPRESEWCLTEILCHLRDVENEVNLSRLQKVIAEQNPFLPGMDTDRWAQERSYANQSGYSALAEFMERRIQLLNLLDNLGNLDWDRPARHAIFGPTQLQELVSIIANHDRLHVQQVFRCIKNISP